jgi:hypothetical protein
LINKHWLPVTILVVAAVAMFWLWSLNPGEAGKEIEETRVPVLTLLLERHQNPA